MSINTHSLDLELSSSQYAYVADTVPLSITGDLTLEAWAQVEQTPATAVSDFMIMAKNETTGNKRSYYLILTNGGNMQFGVSTDGTNITSANFAYTPTVGIWTHYAVTYNAAAGTCVFYINGAQGGTGASLATSIHDNDSRFSIGAYETRGTPTGFFDGLIDEVRVWNDIRTATEIATNMSSELIPANEANLVGYWKLNNDYTDSTANAATLTASGSPVFSTETLPYTTKCSLDLELGSSQYAKLADNATMSITGNMTLMGWVKFESTTATMSLISKYDSGNDQRSYSLRYNTATGLIDFVISSDGTAANATTASSNYGYFLNDTWFHVAVTYNAAGGSCKFYINGALDALGASLKTSIFNGTADFRIGADDNTSGTGALIPFDGSLSEVKVFNAELTAAQVLDEMHQSSSLNSPVGYWKLNNDYTDSSGNGQTLTAVATPIFVNWPPFPASGTTLTIQTTGVTDTYLTSNEPTVNKDGEGINVGEFVGSTEIMRGLVKFDLSDIPSNAIINSVFLILTFTEDHSTSARVFNVFRVLRAWVANQATWNVYSTGNSWGTAGATNTTTDREAVAINTYHAQVSAPDTTNGRKSIILNAARIQEMITGGGFTNNGFLLQVNIESDDCIYYASTDNATAAKRPILLIDYTTPTVASTVVGYSFFM